MSKRLWTLVALAALAACSAPARTSRAAAQVTAEVLGGAGKAPREHSSEACYPACPDGFGCNADTAACERLPCGGKCRTDQRCNTTGMIESCVSLAN